MTLLHFRDFSVRQALYDEYRTLARDQLAELKDHLMVDRHRNCTMCNGCRQVRLQKYFLENPDTLWKWISRLEEESI